MGYKFSSELMEEIESRRPCSWCGEVKVRGSCACGTDYEDEEIILPEDWCGCENQCKCRCQPSNRIYRPRRNKSTEAKERQREGWNKVVAWKRIKGK